MRTPQAKLVWGRCPISVTSIPDVSNKCQTSLHHRHHRTPVCASEFVEHLFDISGYTLYTFIYLHIPSYILIYFKISNIRKMRPDIRHKNGHKTKSRASPMARIWHAPSYHIAKGFSIPKGIQFKLNSPVFESFGGVIKLQNPINRGLVYFP